MNHIDTAALFTTPGGIALNLTGAVDEHRVLPVRKLAEDEVGERFGVGHTILRRAQRILAQDGSVTQKRNRGAFTVKLSVREARAVFRARALLEPATARAAAPRVIDVDLTVIDAHVANDHPALARGVAGWALHLSGQFHFEIVRITDHNAIESFLRQLVSRLSLVIAVYWRRRNALWESLAHHALLHASGARDSEEESEPMKGHLIDLLSRLDLRDQSQSPRSLRQALAR